jgi:uncharacterized Tic20 family protein
MSVPPSDVNPSPPVAAAPSAEEKQWALFAHLSAFTGFFTGIGAIVAPLIIWLIKKDTMPFVNDQGKEALNFNITVVIVVFTLLVFSVMTLGIGLIVSVPLWFLIGLLWFVFTIVAAIKASEGVAYRYPMCLRLIK